MNTVSTADWVVIWIGVALGYGALASLVHTIIQHKKTNGQPAKGAHKAHRKTPSRTPKRS